MTPPGRWLRHINNSTNFTANDTTGGRNEYSVRYQVLPPHLLPTLVSRCRSELTEFTKWNHLPQVGSPLPCFTNRVSSMYSLAGNLHSLQNQVLWVHFWRHSGIYQSEDLITRCSDNAFLFYQDVWSDCFSFVIMHCTLGCREDASWKIGLDTRD